MADLDRPILDAAISLIAEVGIRGAALRKIGQRAGIHFTNLSKKYGSKNALIAESFAEVAQRDLIRLRYLIDNCLNVRLGNDATVQLLWMSCDDFGGDLRNEGIVLAELMLASEADATLADICANWLTARRDQLRRLARAIDVDVAAFDVLGIIMVSEMVFAASCHRSPRFRLLARYGLEAAYYCLTDQLDCCDITRERSLIEQFYLSPPLVEDAGPTPERKRRDETVNRIVDAAVSLIQETGVQAITVKAVADRAGISTTLASYYFESVSDIYYAGISRIFEETHDRTIRAARDLDRVYADISPRVTASEIPRKNQLVYRGMIELLLAAARDRRQRALAISTRQLIGSVTFAALGHAPQDLAMRLRATAYSLWAMPSLIFVPLLAGRGPGWDFAAQSRVAMSRLIDVESRMRMPIARSA